MRQGVLAGGAGDQAHHGVSKGNETDIEGGDGEHGGKAPAKGHPGWKDGGDQVISRGANDGDHDNAGGKAAPAKPANDPPGNERDRRTGDGEPEIEEQQEGRRLGESHTPPSAHLAERDDAHAHEGHGHAARQGSHEAPRRRAREVGDGDQCGQVEAGHEKNVLS